MRKKLLSTTTVFLIVGLFLPSPCAARKISVEEKGKIRTICVSSELGDDVYYVRIGTTIFQNYTDRIPAKEMLSAMKSGVEKALRSRGYSIVGDHSKSDYVLVMQGGVPNRSERGNGVGFGVRTSFGMFQGMVAGGSMFFRLKDSNTGTVRASTFIDRAKTVRIRKAPNHWSEFTLEEKAAMFQVLRSQLAIIPEEALQKLGL
jgi:hypothetical protein